MNQRRRRFLGAVAGTATAGLVGVAGYARRSNAGSGAARTQGGTVLMSARQGNVYDPVGLYVEPGATVVWELESGVHSSTSYEDRIPEGAEPWDTGIVSEPGATVSRTFEVEGTYDYYCLPHRANGMVGRIVVGTPGGPAEGSMPTDGPVPESQRIVQEGSVAAGGLGTGRILITYEGEVSPGNAVTITATLDGEPVVGANVFQRGAEGDDEWTLVGTTDENGRLQVTIPSSGDRAGDLRVRIRQGEREGELEVEPGGSGDSQEGPIRVDYSGTVSPGATVTITATLNGEPVVGADVFVRDGDDERQLVGQTDENGQLQVTVPAEGDNAGELDVQVRRGELEGELEVG
ncbi:plastocyanin/azurin family copper-binding protein [Halorarum salinum]|uniref:Blue (type 1) copper domain-containing protein n=1 Tax=Halorarum salinum TaxID=2743089 RepID=A0A7D5QN23_9EURY|nr:plastocyanin/azurin family copper-binding protein [Halobaculum salinum]QLG63865.1 hypothetical protein HUG12_19920 [Halobaculum salinum]